MEYGKLKDGTFFITTKIKDIKNIAKTYKTEKEFIKAGGVIPEFLKAGK